MYADEIEIYGIYYNENHHKIRSALQTPLAKMSVWASGRDLHIKYDKFLVMNVDDVHFGGEGEKEGDSDEEHYENDIIVIANRFPKDLNYFCNPRNELMRDRICFGQVDAYALACADDTPPLHLVPFCLVFKRHCSMISYPDDDWCSREFDRYDDFCTRTKINKCKSCSYDLSCQCEPYECLWRRGGYNTAIWCQRYELFCNEKERRNKANELIALMQDAVRIHYRCMHLFNLPKVICDPFRRQFDYERCTKFLFDCELISEWGSEEESGEKETAAEKVTGEGEGPKKTLKPTAEDAKLAAKIAEEEMALERLLKEKEKESKGKGEQKTVSAVMSSVASNITLVTSPPSNSSTVTTTTERMDPKTKSAIVDNPFSAVKLPEIKP
ncbi:hypothetical protein RB195_009334 [Necator americanus]|uniref:Uncharacterized protein n=1 Tax=Necator americanus TaxID=51031 RepID=A0ABR1CWA8_NECAM